MICDGVYIYFYLVHEITITLLLWNCYENISLPNQYIIKWFIELTICHCKKCFAVDPHANDIVSFNRHTYTTQLQETSILDKADLSH